MPAPFCPFAYVQIWSNSSLCFIGPLNVGCRAAGYMAELYGVYGVRCTPWPQTPQTRRILSTREGVHIFLLSRYSNRNTQFACFPPQFYCFHRWGFDERAHMSQSADNLPMPPRPLYYLFIYLKKFFFFFFPPPFSNAR